MKLIIIKILFDYQKKIKILFIILMHALGKKVTNNSLPKFLHITIKPLSASHWILKLEIYIQNETKLLFFFKRKKKKKNFLF